MSHNVALNQHTESIREACIVYNVKMLEFRHTVTTTQSCVTTMLCTCKLEVVHYELFNSCSVPTPITQASNLPTNYRTTTYSRNVEATSLSLHNTYTLLYLKHLLQFKICVIKLTCVQSCNYGKQSLKCCTLSMQEMCVASKFKIFLTRTQGVQLEFCGIGKTQRSFFTQIR